MVGEAVEVRRIFNSMPLAVVAFRGPHHQIVAISQSCRALLPKLPAVGEPLWAAFPDLPVADISDTFDRVLQTGEQHEVREWRVELDLDGSGHLQTYFIDATVTARRGENGETDGVQVLFRDVTDRVRGCRIAEARAVATSQRYEQMSASATALQLALRASSVPVLPGLDLAAEYVVAAEGTAAGGDWFDAIPTEDGAVVLIVGDVVGRGAEAAAVMSQLRCAARMHVLSGMAITETMEAVQNFSEHLLGALSVTMCIGRLDSESGVFTYCTAGHPPPLIISNGQSRYAHTSGSGPLGSRHPHVVNVESLGVGDTLLLYTDGLIERPQQRWATSAKEFASVATSILTGDMSATESLQHLIDELCSRVLQVHLRDGLCNEGMTLIAAQRISPVPAFHLSVDTDPQSTHLVKGRWREWLASLGADAADVMLVEYAVSEYVDTFGDRCSSDCAGLVTIDAVLGPDATLRFSATDSRRWKFSDSAGSRCGLSIAHSSIEGTHVVGSDDGTRVEMMYPLSKAARLLTGPMIVRRDRQPSCGTDFVCHIEPDGLMIVGGDIDALQAQRLARCIAGQSRFGTLSLDIDLSLVTYLSSAAAQVLSDVRARADTHGAAVNLIAPQGSTAHHILATIALPTGAR